MNFGSYIDDDEDLVLHSLAPKTKKKKKVLVHEQPKPVASVVPEQP